MWNWFLDYWMETGSWEKDDKTRDDDKKSPSTGWNTYAIHVRTSRRSTALRPQRDWTLSPRLFFTKISKLVVESEFNTNNNKWFQFNFLIYSIRSRRRLHGLMQLLKGVIMIMSFPLFRPCRWQKPPIVLIEAIGGNCLMVHWRNLRVAVGPGCFPWPSLHPLRSTLRLNTKKKQKKGIRDELTSYFT